VHADALRSHPHFGPVHGEDGPLGDHPHGPRRDQRRIGQHRAGRRAGNQRAGSGVAAVGERLRDGAEPVRGGDRQQRRAGQAEHRQRRVDGQHRVHDRAGLRLVRHRRVVQRAVRLDIADGGAAGGGQRLQRADLVDDVGRELRSEEIILDDRYHAGTYGLADPTTVDAIKLGARLEGMITDPVYEGKSLAALIDMIARREIDPRSTVLYAHLGGQPALNGYSALFD